MPAAPLDPTVAWTRRIAVASLLAMVALGLAWELWLAPLRPGGSWLALKVLPLCIPLAGLLIWLYFTEGVVRAWSDPLPAGRWCAAAQLLLCLLLFAACAMHVRLRFRNARLAAAAGE